MAADLFTGLCDGFGYRPDAVLSVRVTPRSVVVAFVDEGGALRTAVHRMPAALASTAPGAPLPEPR